MEQVTMRELVSAVRGQAEGFGHMKMGEISTDSRTIREGDVFFAILGERLNGHDYVETALERGAAAAVVSEQREGWPSERLIVVENTTKALLDFAAWYRTRFSLHMVAVTGSVGKTTTKEMIAAVLSAGGPTMKSQGNQNNEIGLPKTLLSITSKDRYGVVELGMSNLHEIERLSAAAKPEIGVITNVGVSHLETLHTRENILRAKLEICEGIADGGVLIRNIDNDLLRNASVPRLRNVTYGLNHPDADIRVIEYTEEQAQTQVRIRWQGSDYDAVIPCIGEHNVYNAAAAFAVGVTLGIAPESIIPALLKYEPTGMRQRVVQFRNMLVIEDCYNASPDSMRAALNTLVRLSHGKKVAVFADMLELGAISDSSHKTLGEWAASSGVDLLLCYGPQTRLTVDAAKASGLTEAYHFESKETLSEFLTGQVGDGDAILVKGSRSMALEDVLRSFYASK